jgi:hypothetical protein
VLSSQQLAACLRTALSRTHARAMKVALRNIAFAARLQGVEYSLLWAALHCHCRMSLPHLCCYTTFHTLWANQSRSSPKPGMSWQSVALATTTSSLHIVAQRKRTSERQ